MQLILKPWQSPGRFKQTIKTKKMMKKLVFALMLLVSVQINGQIKISGHLETGSYNEKTTYNAPNIINGLRMSYYCGYIDGGIKFTYERLFVQQEMFSIVDIGKSGYTLKPFEIDFITTIGYKWKNITIGYKHSCLHPIVNDVFQPEKILRRTSTDKIFFRIDFN